MASNDKKNDKQGRAGAAGDNRSAEDLDGNQAGAKTANRAPGPNEPETPTQPTPAPTTEAAKES